MSSPGAENAYEFGIGERLYLGCLALFSALSQEELALKNFSDLDNVNEELGRFYLWGEGFRGSRLDVLLATFPSLRASILRNLVMIGKILRDNIEFSRDLSDNLKVVASALESTLEITQLNIPPDPETDHGDPGGDDRASDSSGSSVREFLDDIHFYITLLMRLVPSMERSLGQVLQDKQREQADSSSDKLLERSSSSGMTAAALSETARLATEWKSGPSTDGRSGNTSMVNDTANTADTLIATDLRLDAVSTTERLLQVPSTKGSQALHDETSIQQGLQPLPPPYSVTHNLEPLPTRPVTASELKFRNLLLTLSERPLQYENPVLLDETLSLVPVDRIYAEAEEEHNVMKAEAASIGEKSKTEWGYQDCVVVSLLRWFKRDFFKWVANPDCSVCTSATIEQGHTAPRPGETACGATKVELYRCSNPGCGAYERFPRYSNPWTLRRTRKGRVGEFALCFGMFCRAVGARVRYVWNSEDHIWIEHHSEHQKRWVHIDVCEGIFDQPRMYTEGWGRKLAYCIAFSVDGAADVTRRYVRDKATWGLSRTRAPEEVLLWIMSEIRSLRRKDMDKTQLAQLHREDDREEREMTGYVAKALVQQLIADSENFTHGSDSVKAGRTTAGLVKRTAGEMDTESTPEQH